MNRPLSPIAVRVLVGVAWGLIVAAAEISILPVEAMGWRDQASVAVGVAWAYLLTGVSLALLFGWLAPRMTTYALILAVIVSLVAAQFVQGQGMAVLSEFGEGPAKIFGRAPDSEAVFVHGIWLHLFFGGLALAAYLLRRRADRTRAFIARSMIAARESEAALAVASAKALRGQLEPERLAGYVLAVRARYQVDLAAGDLLLERLTDYLRAAMPAIRTGRSTAAADRDTARCLRILNAALAASQDAPLTSSAKSAKSARKVPDHENC